MRTISKATILLIAAVIFNAAAWTWVYRSPPVSFFGYLFFVPRGMDLKELAFRLGWKKVPAGEEEKYRARLRGDPADAEAAFVLGYFAYRERKLEEAVENLELAAQNGFPQPKVHYWLARAYAESGRRRQALAEYNQVTLKMGLPYVFRLSLQLDAF